MELPLVFLVVFRASQRLAPLRVFPGGWELSFVVHADGRLPFPSAWTSFPGTVPSYLLFFLGQSLPRSFIPAAARGLAFAPVSPLPPDPTLSLRAPRRRVGLALVARPPSAATFFGHCHVRPHPQGFFPRFLGESSGRVSIAPLRPARDFPAPPSFPLRRFSLSRLLLTHPSLPSFPFFATVARRTFCGATKTFEQLQSILSSIPF